MKRPAKSSFPRALRAVRRAKGMAQEEFDQVSSRTYVSSLERGLKDPTLGKVDSLAEVLQVHPLSLLTAAYLSKPTPMDIDRLLGLVKAELEELQGAGLSWRT